MTDLGDLSEFLGHNYKNVASYLMACGFDYYEANYKTRKYYNDYENNRCIMLDLEDDPDKAYVIEGVTLLDKCFER